MINPPPKTGDTALDGFLRSVYEQSRELEAKAIPEDGWSLTDFTAEVSGVIGDKRDLIDIVTQYDSIEDYLALVDDQKQLLEDALTKVESIEVSADWFAQIMEWWDQNYKIIQDAQESLKYKREADAAALEAKQYAAETEEDRLAAARSLADAQEAASDAALYRQGALTYRESSKRYSEASDAAKGFAEAAQALAEDFRDGAKEHREAAKISETNAEASASAASTDANKSAGSATEAAGEVTKAEAAREQVEAVEAALRALMADTEAWQDVSFALDSVDGRISTGMQQVKDDILGGVGPAFDTLLELAEALGENADAIGTLTNELAKKAEKGHTHTSADITDAVPATMLDESLANKVMKTDGEGMFRVISNPAHAHHVTNKYYVDTEVAKKANTSHTHTISETSGLQTALDGKAPESHIHAIADVDGLNAALEARSADGHKHTSADITDATAAATADRVIRRNSSGDFSVNSPIYDSYPANKAYVDGEIADAVAKKTDTGHKHTVSEITDYPGHTVVMGSNSHGKIPLKEADSDNIRVQSAPEKYYHLTNRSYVDQEVAKKADSSHSHSWSEITGKPSTFKPTSHDHSWSEITSKPSTFKPSSHSHTISNVTGLQAALDAKANSSHSHSWGQVTGKPSTFPPSSHSHSWSQVTSKPSTFKPSSHNHTSSDITDTEYRAGTTASAGKVISASGTGRLYYDRTPAATDELANKEYVDDRTPPVKVVDSLPSSPAADTLYFVKE